jgi:hypothetical protein
VYLVVRKLVDPDTGELVGALVPANGIDARLLRERKFSTGREVRAELKQPRNPAFHRLAHAIGHLLVDNVEEFRDLDGHGALKAVQTRSGVCCEPLEIDLGTLGKVTAQIARSLAFDEMSEDQFRLFFDGVTAYIGEHYTSVMLDDVRTEFWLMCNGDTA